MDEPRPAYLSFDRIADEYEATRSIPVAVVEQAARAIARDARLAGDQFLLDAGIGTGRFARHLARVGVPLVGVDVSGPMLDRAAATTAARGLVRGDLRRLPFRDGVFEGALIVHILHLIADWKGVLAEVRRVLRPGAPLYLGAETGKWYRAYGLYFEVANERGLVQAHLGAPSFDAVLEELRAEGARPRPLAPARLRWTASDSVASILDNLQANPFSPLWHLDAAEHDSLFAEAERRIRAAFPSLQEIESTPVELKLWRAAWPD